jgi:hypothetical protein
MSASVPASTGRPVDLVDLPPTSNKGVHLVHLTGSFSLVEKDLDVFYLEALLKNGLPLGNILVSENDSKKATNLREIKRLLGLRTKSTADIKQNEAEICKAETAAQATRILEARVILFRRRHQLDFQLLTSFEERFVLFGQKSYLIVIHLIKEQWGLDLKATAFIAIAQQPWLRMWLKGPLYTPSRIILPLPSGARVDVQSVLGSTDSKKEHAEEECPICVTDLHSQKEKYSGVLAKTTPVLCAACNRRYHVECLLTWFNEVPGRETCPMCRGAIDYAFIFKLVSVRIGELREIEKALAAKQDEVAAKGEGFTQDEPSTLVTTEEK